MSLACQAESNGTLGRVRKDVDKMNVDDKHHYASLASLAAMMLSITTHRLHVMPGLGTLAQCIEIWRRLEKTDHDDDYERGRLYRQDIERLEKTSHAEDAWIISITTQPEHPQHFQQRQHLWQGQCRFLPSPFPCASPFRRRGRRIPFNQSFLPNWQLLGF